jgi:flagellar biosynthetic protein FliP
MMRTASLLLTMAALAPLWAVEAPMMDTPAGASQSDLVTPAASATSSNEIIDSGGQDPSGQPSITPSAQSGDLTLSVTGGGEKGASTAVTLLLLITALSVAPAFLMMMTSFTRIIIVLGFVRRALGTQTLPPNQVMLGLALFLTLFVMAPTLKQVNDQALQPYLAGTLPQADALTKAKGVVRDFMLKHTRKTDLALFIKLAREERPQSVEDVSFATLLPAFMTSELKTSFQMGFIIFLPFLVIDLVISAVLMALGMMMLPPVVVSLPFKVLLFVLVDGWVLLLQGLVASYG